MSAADVNNRVDPAFWEDDYLGDVELPSRPDPGMATERCMLRALGHHAPVAAGARVLEVGCAPGKWLAFYAERFGARVEGIEYTRRGAELTRANLRACGVDGVVHQLDFFDAVPSPHDLVLSLGFIEHFDDLETAFVRHVDFVGEGGRLAIGVPNYRGLNRWLQRHSDPAHLRMHNLAAMEPGLYRELAGRHGLDVTYLDHIGGFDPVIIRVGRRSIASPVVLLEQRYRRLSIADRINHPLASSYLLAVMQRR